MSEIDPAPIPSITFTDVFTIISERTVFHLLNDKNYTEVNWSSPTDPIAILLSGIITSVILFVKGYLKGKDDLLYHPIVKQLTLMQIIYYIYAFNPGNDMPVNVKTNFTYSTERLESINAGAFILEYTDTNLLKYQYTDTSFLNY